MWMFGYISPEEEKEMANYGNGLLWKEIDPEKAHYLVNNHPYHPF